MIYKVSRRPLRFVMGVLLLLVFIWFILSGLAFSGFLYGLFSLITFVLAVNVLSDGVGLNKIIVSKNEIVVYRLPFFIKRIPIDFIDRLDYIESNSVLSSKEILRVFYSSNRHIRVSNYSSDASIIKMEIEKHMTKCD